MPRLYNILVLFFIWIFFAGFIIFPGIFIKFYNYILLIIKTGIIG
jgi:hypothetical protein